MYSFSSLLITLLTQPWHLKPAANRDQFVRLALSQSSVESLKRLLELAYYSCVKKASQQSKLGRKQGYLSELNVDLQQQDHDSYCTGQSGLISSLRMCLIRLLKALQAIIKFEKWIIRLILDATILTCVLILFEKRSTSVVFISIIQLINDGSKTAIINVK
jgi:hypothetical protein